MTVQVIVVPASSHNHIKTTTKLYNSPHSELPEIWLNGHPTTRELNKKPHQDWQEGQRHGIGRSHTNQCWIKIGRNILAVEIPPEQRQFPAPHQALHPRVLVLGREVPITSGCKNQQGLRLGDTEAFWGTRQFLLKDLCTDLYRLTSSEIQHWDSSSKGTRDLLLSCGVVGVLTKPWIRRTLQSDDMDHMVLFSSEVTVM